ncbi:MAG: tRNA 2-thiouridine(34) synthase MnmA [Pseudomonadota bacterium]
MTHPHTLAIALSGGIDSLVSAYLLKQGGHTVFGIHFSTGFETAAVDVARLGNMLGIPVHRVDLSASFQKFVVDYFVTTYLKAQTPNPCLICNKTIKFHALLQAAIALGASRLATGHYARIEQTDKGCPVLLKGKDPLKDQSYFLAMLTEDQLRQAVFPLGEFTKDEVRTIARKAGLEPLQKKESQDICFLNDTSVSAFIEKVSGIAPCPGPIVTVQGETIGEHHGLHRFTIGQRRGIDCPGPEPYYVIALDMGKNTLIVGTRSQMYRQETRVAGLAMMTYPLVEPVRVTTRIRYSHPGAKSLLSPVDDLNALVTFDTPQPAVTPGQVAVFYQDDAVLGAGIIQ